LIDSCIGVEEGVGMNKKVMLASFLSILLFLVMLGTVFMTRVRAQDPEGTLDLFDAVDEDHNVTWVLGRLPATYPNFTLDLKITNITNAYAVAFSIHWDPTILNLTWPGGVTIDTNCIFGTPGDPAPHGTGGTVFLCGVDIIHFADGNLSDCAYCELYPYVLLNITSPSCGKVCNLTFQFIGTPPTVGSPIDTNITILHEDWIHAGGYKMPTWWSAWEAGKPVVKTFSVLGSCHFHYERGTPAPVGGIYIPVNKLALLAPYIALAITIIVATVATATFIKHKKRQ
jgi:hypothetical protein